MARCFLSELAIVFVFQDDKESLPEERGLASFFFGAVANFAEAGLFLF